MGTQDSSTVKQRVAIVSRCLVPGTSGKGPDIDVAVARSCCSLARPPCGLAALAFTDNLPGRIRHRFIFMIRAN